MASRYTLWLRGVTLLLLVQLILGIWVNVRGSLPSTRNVATAVMYRGDPAFTAHVLLAVVLVVLAFVLAILAFGSEAPARLRWFTLGGFLALLGAYEAGVQLILSGFASNLDSIAMTAAFLVAMAFYGLAQLVVGRAARANLPPGPSTPA